MAGKKSPHSIESRIVARIRAKGRGWVLTPSDFVEFGNRSAIHIALMRLTRSGMIRRLARGMYDYPILHPTLGALAPSTTRITEALAARDGARVLPAGPLAANLLGLSEQVPMREVFMTTGGTSTKKLGRRSIRIVRGAARTMRARNAEVPMLVEALRHLGTKTPRAEAIAALRGRLPADVRARMLREAHLAPDWAAAVIRKIAPGPRKRVRKDA